MIALRHQDVNATTLAVSSTPQKLGVGSDQNGNELMHLVLGRMDMMSSMLEQVSTSLNEQSERIAQLEAQVQKTKENTEHLQNTVQELMSKTALWRDKAGIELSRISSKVEMMEASASRTLAAEEVSLLLSLPGDPDETRVLDCIRAGADLHYKDQKRKGMAPLLHTLVSRGLVNAVRVAMLERQDPLDLRLVDADETGCTVLHLVVSTVPNDVAEQLLILIRRRIGNFRAIVAVDWEQKNAAGDDVVNAAARHGRLSLFWKHMESVSYWDDKMAGEIELWVRPRADDWDALGEHGQKFFSLQIVHDARSAELVGCFRVSTQNGGADVPVQRVAELVAQGADVNAVLFPSCGKTILYWLLEIGRFDHFAACLQTLGPINWTLTTSDEYQNPVIHALFVGRKKKAEDVQRVLTLILNRLENHPEDIMDWGQKSSRGHDCVSIAARWGHLTTFWNTVTTGRVPYYVNRVGPVIITCKAVEDDVNRLTTAVGGPTNVAKLFIFKEGYGPTVSFS